MAGVSAGQKTCGSADEVARGRRMFRRYLQIGMLPIKCATEADSSNVRGRCVSAARRVHPWFAATPRPFAAAQAALSFLAAVTSRSPSHAARIAIGEAAAPGLSIFAAVVARRSIAWGQAPRSSRLQSFLHHPESQVPDTPWRLLPRSGQTA